MEYDEIIRKMESIKCFISNTLHIEPYRMPNKDEDVFDYLYEGIFRISYFFFDQCKMNLFSHEYMGMFGVAKLDNNVSRAFQYPSDTLYNNIFNHCLLDAYDKLQYILFSEEGESYYSFLKYYQYCGIDYLKGNGYYEDDVKVRTQNRNLIFKDAPIGIEFESSRNQALQKKLKTVYNDRLGRRGYIDTYYNYYLCRAYGCKDKKINFYYLPIIQLFFNREGIFNIWNRISVADKIRTADIKDFVSKITQVYKNPFSACSSEEKELRMTNVDKLYYVYKLERLFGFETITDIISATKWFDGFNVNDFDENELYSLVSVIKLPNVFSRIVYIEAILSAISSIYCNIEYIRSEKLFKNKITDDEEKKEFYNLLDTQINFLSELFYPLVEGAIMIYLYDWCKSQSGNAYITDPKELFVIMNDQIRAILNDDEIFDSFHLSREYVYTTTESILENICTDKTIEGNEEVSVFDEYKVLFTAYKKVVSDLIKHKMYNVLDTGALNLHDDKYFYSLIERLGRKGKYTVDFLKKPADQYGSNYLKIYNKEFMEQWRIGLRFLDDEYYDGDDDEPIFTHDF